MLVLLWVVTADLYSFYLIVLLNADFNCIKTLLSSSVDRMTTGTYNFVSVILNVGFVGAFIAGIAGSALGLAACVNISQNTIFRPCQNKIYFKCSFWWNNNLKIFFSLCIFLLSLFTVFLICIAFSVILVLYLKDSEFVMGFSL